MVLSFLKGLRKESAALPGRAAPQLLTTEQRAQWEHDGYLVLQGAVSAQERAVVLGEVDRNWREAKGNDHVIDVLSGPLSGQSFKMDDAPIEARSEVYKLNNTFARSAVVRGVALNPRIHDALADLLQGEPLICNSLNFERGSQQPFHLDTWYMPPPVESKMIAAIIALEDIGPLAGPFTYYPGSHKIKPYRFSNGALNIIDAEAHLCNDYLKREIEARGLESRTLSCKAGDVFLWHDNLLHGGLAIKDMTKTRRSMVVHYWRREDLPGSEVRGASGGYYLGRTLRGEITF